MMLIGYRMLFGELCTLLNIHLDPDADYVEDDLAREILVRNILKSVRGTNLEIMVISDDVYYLGLSMELCSQLLSPIMTTRKMSDHITACSILVQRELKKVGLFKHLDSKLLRISDPTVIQCDHIHPIMA
jgi:hypothetical protein